MAQQEHRWIRVLKPTKVSHFLVLFCLAQDRIIIPDENRIVTRRYTRKHSLEDIQYKTHWDNWGTTLHRLALIWPTFPQSFVSRSLSLSSFCSTRIPELTPLSSFLAYGYNCAVYPPNHSAHLKISRHAADAVREVYGTNYTYGQSCQYLYQSTGYSVDYNYAVTKARYSYLIELRDRGQFGFVLPPVQILPVVLETWQGFREILKRIWGGSRVWTLEGLRKLIFRNRLLKWYDQWVYSEFIRWCRNVITLNLRFIIPKRVLDATS